MLLSGFCFLPSISFTFVFPLRAHIQSKAFAADNTTRSRDSLFTANHKPSCGRVACVAWSVLFLVLTLLFWVMDGMETGC